MAERRPALTASARDGVGNLRSGRKKACGAVEQKKALKQEKACRRCARWALKTAGVCRIDQAADRDCHQEVVARGTGNDGGFGRSGLPRIAGRSA